MRQGKGPTEAAREAILCIKHFYPNFFGAIIATTVSGDFGAACSGMEKFHYSVVRFESNSDGARGLSKVNVEEAICEKFG